MPAVNIVHYGQYYLTRNIATGGMAELFRARKVGAAGFEKLLAVKRLLPHLARNREFLAMFLDEARLASQLNHQNIAQVYDLGCLEDQGGPEGETYFLAMEYVFGKNLAEIQKAGQEAGLPLALDNLVKVVLSVAVGLAYANAKLDHSGRALGIVHRDISPANILISYEGEVKLTDFGIAKALSQSSVTQPGVLKGKFAYMSPEQAKGQPLDTRSDIFSLGIVLWEGLTGRRLFAGPSEAAILHLVSQCQVPAPSSPGAALPTTLEAICLKCLAADPRDRYESAEHLARDLEAFLRELTTYPGTYSLRGHLHKLFGQAMALETDQIRDEDEALRRLVQDGGEQTEPATVLWRDLTEASPAAETSAPPVRPAAPPPVSRPAPPWKKLALAGVVLGVLLLVGLTRLAWVPQEPNPDTTPKPGQVSHLPQAYQPRPPGPDLARSTEQPPTAEPSSYSPGVSPAAEPGESSPGAAVSSSPAQTDPVAIQEIRELLNAGQYEQALAMIRRLEAGQPGSAGQLGPEKSAALVGVAMIGVESNPAQALPLLREAVQADSSNPNAFFQLGRAHFALGQTGQALAAYGHAVDLAPNLAEAHFNMGLALLQRESLPQAMQAFQRVVDLGGELVDESYVNLGICLARQGDRERAMEMFQKALARNPNNDSATRYLEQVRLTGAGAR